ncbi:hypothetical protein F5141DRAFT_1068240 [Pisolithus sp. B1]|nr:hypothetical protein F5141DRAFT_1068240 [Pisolithus sp. B1]
MPCLSHLICLICLSSHHLMSYQCPNFHQPAPPVPNFNQPSPPVPNFHQSSLIFDKPHEYTPLPPIAQLPPDLPTRAQLPPVLPPHQCPTSTSLYTSFSPPSHISMARTKQTARKVTGGHAPRVNLEVLQKKKAKAKAASKKAPLKIPAMDNAVIICLDGGEMWVCDEEGCHRVRVRKADVKFMCMTCHWQKTKNDPKPYVVAMLHSFLQAYFPQGDYNFSQLSFNLGTPESMDAYDKAVSDLANTLSAYSRVVLFLTTHSDEDRGDLFTGYINKKPVAYKVLPFLQLLLKPLSKIVNGADIVFYVWLCGHQSPEFQWGKGGCPTHLQLASTVPYLQSLLDNTIIQGFPISSAAKVALNDCGMLGRHSNIILFTWQEEALVVEKFLWTDKHLKPWGHLLPVQCPQCGTIQKWVGGSAGKTISFECKYPDCGKNMGAGGVSLPPKTYSFSIPENATQLLQGQRGNSSWLQITL